jgi:hypothetical protein
MVTPEVDKNQAIAQWFNRSSPEPEKADLQQDLDMSSAGDWSTQSRPEDTICSDSDGGMDVDSEPSIEGIPMRQIVKRKGNKKNQAKDTKVIETQSPRRADDDSKGYQQEVDSQRAEEMRQFLELGI